jgi:HTH-type transcriptional regulator/antitoxin HigA
MKPKIIKTETDYEEALAYLETLMDAEPGTPQEEELELFAHLIENYERVHFPIGLPDPIEAIQFRMEQQGLTRKDLEPYIGSQSKVSEVLNRKRPLSLAMIRALHKGLDIPAEVLLQEEGRTLTDPQYELNRYPFTDMYNEGYFPFFNGTLAEAKEAKEEVLNGLFRVCQGMSFEKALTRTASAEKMDAYALEAWQARVLTLAQEQELSPYTSDFPEANIEYLVHLSAFDKGPLLAREYLQKRGIPLVILKHLPHTYLDGACFKAASGRPVIGLTLRHDRMDNFWFTLLHELGHLLLHLDQHHVAFFDETENHLPQDDLRNPWEKEADAFASRFLIPEEAWKTWRKTNDRLVSKEQIRSFANRLGISPAIVAGRLRWETGDYGSYSNLLGNKGVKKLF